MGQIPCGPVLASKEEGELIHVHESEHMLLWYSIFRNWHNGSNCIIFANIVTMTICQYCYLMVEVFSRILGTFLINFLTVKLKPMQ